MWPGGIPAAAHRRNLMKLRRGCWLWHVTQRLFLIEPSPASDSVTQTGQTSNGAISSSLVFWTVKPISSANWPQNKQATSITQDHNMLFLLKQRHPSLQEPCKGDCYLVFPTYRRVDPPGITLLILSYLWLWHQVSMFEKFFSLSSALLTLPLNFGGTLRSPWYFSDRSVWSESVTRMRTICQALAVPGSVSSVWCGESFGAIGKWTNAQPNCWWHGGIWFITRITWPLFDLI